MSGREARQRAFRLADQLMSPFCPGLLLSTCQSPGAADVRREIAARLAAGEAESAIIADLVQRYGSGILGSPPAEGLGAVVWSAPAVLGVTTLGVLVAALVRLRTRIGGARGAQPDRDVPGDHADARIDAELEALD